MTGRIIDLAARRQERREKGERDRPLTLLESLTRSAERLEARNALRLEAQMHVDPAAMEALHRQRSKVRRLDDYRDRGEVGPLGD